MGRWQKVVWVALVAALFVSMVWTANQAREERDACLSEKVILEAAVLVQQMQINALLVSLEAEAGRDTVWVKPDPEDIDPSIEVLAMEAERAHQQGLRAYRDVEDLLILAGDGSTGAVRSLLGEARRRLYLHGEMDAQRAAAMGALLWILQQ